MDTERTFEALRLRLLRLVAGLLAAVVFVSVGPFSRGVSRWVAEGVLSILSRAETAAQYLVIVQARIIAARNGLNVDHERLLGYGLRDCTRRENARCLAGLRKRLEALRALLEDLPRHGSRLLHRIEKRLRRSGRSQETSPGTETLDCTTLCAWRLASVRIERPPDR